MKVISFLCLIAMLGGRAFAAENVNISLISLSVQIDPARAEDDIGLEWNLRISSIPDEAIVNGEAAVADLQSNFSNEGFFLLEDPFTGDIAVLPFQMDTPFLDDSNGNGLVDFDDVSVAVVNEQTTGIFFNPASGQFDDMDLVWNRDAGSSTGLLQMSLPNLGLVFLHAYRVPQFSGVFSFNRNGTNLVGQAALTNVVDPNDTIGGPLTLSIKDPATLTYKSGTWAGPNGEVYQYTPEDNLDRIELNYLSFLDMLDGFLATAEQDYQFWLFNVDSADSDHNGTPDIVQGGGTTIARPTMEAIRVPGGIQITITGTVGQSYQLQATDRLAGGTWADLQPVTLSTSPQTVTVQTTGTQRFFQLKQ